MAEEDEAKSANRAALHGIAGTDMRIAIQGERGSNSHMAALAMLGPVEVLACSVSAEVMEAVVTGRAEAAVLPIENSLHGSVAEHYDLLMEHPVRIERESLLRIRHNLIAAPGVRLEDVRWVMSHPVALSQCRRYLAELAAARGARSLPFYDTAGSVKHLMAEGLRDTAGVAPQLAAEVYGAQVLVSGIEDHEQNYTRFHLLRRVQSPRGGPASLGGDLPPADKLSLAFAVEHRPGTLVAALQALSGAGVDLTQIESRPVPGRPWEYVFYVDLRFAGEAMADSAVAALRPYCGVVKELGRYKAAQGQSAGG
jgi:prephenate dehydratase